MITAAEIAPYRTRAVDHAETEALKAELAKLRVERQLFFLTAVELEKILRWKLRGQHSRGRTQRTLNTDDVIRVAGGAALSVGHPDLDYEVGSASVSSVSSKASGFAARVPKPSPRAAESSS